MYDHTIRYLHRNLPVNFQHGYFLYNLEAEKKVQWWYFLRHNVPEGCVLYWYYTFRDCFYAEFLPLRILGFSAVFVAVALFTHNCFLFRKQREKFYKDQNEWFEQRLRKVEHVPNDTSCAVCLDTPFDPVALTCAHIFCDACIKKWFIVKRNMKCPLCCQLSFVHNF